MRQLVRLPLGLLALLAATNLVGLGASDPAQACSFSWTKGHSPRDIPRRADVWKVTGDFVIVDAKTGAVVPPGTEFNLTEDKREMLGRIDRKRGKPLMTKQLYFEEWAIDCGFVLTPQNPVSDGVFWIERKADKNGRHRMMMWKSRNQ